MNKTFRIKEANKFFTEKNYLKSLELYLQIQKDSPDLAKTLNANIILCKKRINKYIDNSNLEKIIVYTVNVGGYESIKEPLSVDPTVDYVLFTDDKNAKSKFWKIIQIEKKLHDPRRTSRLAKILAHQFLPEHDISVYIDSSLEIKTQDVRQMVSECMEGKDIALYKHYKRDCVYDEINYVMNSTERVVANKELCKQAIQKYEAINYPKKNGLFENAFIFRRNTNEIKQLNELWWKEYQSGTERDQFVLMFALYKLKIKPNIIRKGKQFRNNKYVNFHKHEYVSYNQTPRSRKTLNWLTGGQASSGWAYDNNAKRFIAQLQEMDHIVDQAFDQKEIDVNIYFDVLIHYQLGMKFPEGKRNVVRIGGLKPLESLYSHDKDNKRKQKALSKYDLIIALNQELAKKIFKYNKNVYVVPNGLDLSKWSFNVKKYNAKNTFKVGFAASIEDKTKRELKGYDYAKQACERLGLELITLTKGEGKIPHDDMHERFYSEIDCLLHPVAPGKEGSSNVIMEALASGVPVITTKDCGYHAETMVDNENILFVERDVEQICEKLKLLMNPVSHQKLSEAGRVFAEQHHDIAKIARRYEELIFSTHTGTTQELDPKVIPIIPFAPASYKQNLGKVYNDYMEMLADDEWALFLDHDAMFTDPDWYTQIKDVIRGNPDYGLFTCKTSRINNPFQRHGGHEYTHDLNYHLKVGQNLSNEKYALVSDVTFGKSISGVILLISKKVWKQAPFINGFLGVDNKIHHAVRLAGKKVGIIEGLYTYHFYRGDGDLSHAQRLPTRAQQESSANLNVKTFILPSKIDLNTMQATLSKLKEDEWLVLINEDVIFATKYWYLHLEKVLSKVSETDIFVCKNNLTEKIYGYDYIQQRDIGASFTKIHHDKLTPITLNELDNESLKVVCLSGRLTKQLNSSLTSSSSFSIENLIKRTVYKDKKPVLRIEDLYYYSSNGLSQKLTPGNKLKIAMITRSFWPKMAGMEMMVHNLASSFTQLGHDVVMFAPVKKSNIKEIECNYKIIRHPLNENDFSEPVSLFENEHAIKSFDVIYVQSAYIPASFALALKQKFNIPVVLRTHGEDIQVDAEIGYGYMLDPEKKKVILNNLNAVDRNIVIGPHIYEQTIELVKKDNVHLIHNGVNTNLFTFTKNNYLREKFAIPEQTKILLTVGRNVKKKSLHYALLALKELLDKGEDCVLVHMGKEGDAEPLAQVAEKLKVSNYFYELGPVDYFDTPMIYQSSDIFVFPSLHETFGNVTIEAMSCGLPCVEFDYIVNRDKIKDGESGYIVPYGDVKEMSNKIQQLLQNQDQYMDFSMKSREHVVENFSFVEIARRYVGVFYDL